MNVTIISGMPPGRKRALGLLLVLLVLGGAAWLAAPTLTALAFVADLAGIEAAWRPLIPIRPRPLQTEDALVPTRHGPVAVRIYRPAPHAGWFGRIGGGAEPQTAVVFPGVHGGGVDEARLVRFCGRLAAFGVTVACAPLPELREFRITSRSTDQIEDITVWVSDTVAPAAARRVALVGVSFGGGLALAAAGRPALAARVQTAISIGGHGDLARTLRYLCTGRLPDGTLRPPHDYGLAVVAYAAVDLLVPPDQARALEHGIRTFLEASLDESPGQPTGARLLAQARTEAAALPEPARSLLTMVTERDRAGLGRRLEPFVDRLAADPALSPERSPVTRAPVFLLHGLDDNVIPSTETPLLADFYVRQGHPQVRWLLTPLISHAHLTTSPRAADAWRLVRFWADVLAWRPGTGPGRPGA
jgi:pimeloyl-ACP methyl ester carboxylesterase